MKQATWIVLLLAAVIIVGCTAKPAPGKADTSKSAVTQQGDQAQAEVWTCPMHPEVREAKAGKCPKCGMDLVQAKKDDGMVRGGIKKAHEGKAGM